MNTAINGDGFGVGWYAPPPLHLCPLCGEAYSHTLPHNHPRYDNFGPEPCVFKSTMPSWNCTNLQAIAAHVQCVPSPSFLHLSRTAPADANIRCSRATGRTVPLPTCALVRDALCTLSHATTVTRKRKAQKLTRAHSPLASTASNGTISEANCHPFKFGKMLFMQNGTIAHFTKIRVEILEEIKYTTASMIEVRSWPSLGFSCRRRLCVTSCMRVSLKHQGMTDSEHAGALYVHFLPEHDPNKDHSGHVMKEAMLKMIKFILDVVKKEEERTKRRQSEERCLPRSVQNKEELREQSER